jgi:hypothetical protein
MKGHLMKIVLGAALAAGLTLPMGMSTFAAPDDGAACRSRLESARAKIDHDAARHGENSPQVDHDRAKLEQARQWCRDHHSDWDHDRFDVGIYLRK